MTVLAEPKLFELDGRKAYVARLTGESDPDYGTERIFCARRYSLKGKRGLWAKVLEAGWYETQSLTIGQMGNPYKRTAFAFDGVRFTEYPTAFVKFMPIAATGPLPGQPGAWNSDTCECGDTVAHFTPDGFPVCEREECHAKH